MINDSIVYDKHGKRVQRANGVLQSGDRLVTSITVLDAAPRTAALMLLDSGSPSREQLETLRDARNRDLENRWQGSSKQDNQPTNQSSADLIADRDRRLTDAWKH